MYINTLSIGIFARCKSLPQTYKDADKQLTEKYLPIEVDPDIEYEEKFKLMVEWWGMSEKILE